MKKRGLSPIVATALLLTLAILLAAIVFLWAKGFISEQILKFNKPVELQCESVEWKINVIKSGNVYTLEISNRGNIPIYGYVIKRYLEGDAESLQYTGLNLKPGSSTRETVSFLFGNTAISSEYVEFMPTILGTVSGPEEKTKSYVCSGNIKGYTV